MDKSKRVRVRCSRHAESGTCPDPRTYDLPWIETTVFSALGKELRRRKAIGEAIDLYRNGKDAHREAARKRYAEAEARLKEVEAEMDRLTDLLARGIGDPIRIDHDVSKVESKKVVPARDDVGTIVEINGRPRSLCRRPKRDEPSGGTMVAEEGTAK